MSPKNSINKNNNQENIENRNSPLKNLNPPVTILQNIKNKELFKEKVFENVKKKFNFQKTFEEMKNLKTKSIISKF